MEQWVGDAIKPGKIMTKYFKSNNGVLPTEWTHDIN